MNAVLDWLSAYARRHGLEGLSLTVGESLALEFEQGLKVHLDLEDEELLMYAPVGHVQVDDMQGLEALMSANLMWRDTDGATLGLEPYSRSVVLARTWPLALLANAEAVQTRLDRFCHLASTWRQALGG